MLDNIQTETISLEEFKHVFVNNIKEVNEKFITKNLLCTLYEIKSQKDIILYMKEPELIGLFCKIIFKGYYTLGKEKTIFFEMSSRDGTYLEEALHSFPVLYRRRFSLIRYIDESTINYVKKINIKVPGK